MQPSVLVYSILSFLTGLILAYSQILPGINDRFISCPPSNYSWQSQPGYGLSR